jgi:hypothetical protein
VPATTYFETERLVANLLDELLAVEAFRNLPADVDEDLFYDPFGTVAELGLG